ncbi:sodium-dependent glucose transporter 1-like [Dreissena polymorpha]|uniref:sodium-dependent glucose transporter 1-like n=1 Tax=Dreissena polymorpha TaxID=45954 RepID=UPI002264A214|nr:sodium-dependent glucose transporter 1-like [Dreissena polymorpha]
MSDSMSEPNRKLITVMLVLVWISSGLFIGVAGPTMVDLRITLNTSSAEIARSVSAQGFGLFAGALACGFVIDAMGTWKFLLVTLAGTIATVALILMSFVTSLTWLWVLFFSGGTAKGLLDVGKRIYYRHK